ncbi:hypothetical protein MKW98_017479 [Papaver atlanticum]|uniref:Uncharacterized protein n=1 Tax=Papaver atlanticum TaxID=357466 RepID=A0AAD4TEC0_9MAGN|nr:hypothetical protein MKW98_017479 [Papaver atlanticum]
MGDNYNLTVNRIYFKQKEDVVAIDETTVQVRTGSNVGPDPKKKLLLNGTDRKFEILVIRSRLNSYPTYLYFSFS